VFAFGASGDAEEAQEEEEPAAWEERAWEAGAWQQRRLLQAYGPKARVVYTHSVSRMVPPFPSPPPAAPNPPPRSQQQMDSIKNTWLQFFPHTRVFWKVRGATPRPHPVWHLRLTASFVDGFAR